MITRGSSFFTLLSAFAAVGACQSSNSDAGNNASAGNGGTANAGAAGAGHGGSSVAAGTGGDAGAAGTERGGRAGSGGTAGLAGESGNAGGTPSGAGAGGSAGAAGNSEGGTESGAAGAGDGEAGSPGDGKPEFAYLSTFLGGVFAFSIDLVTGAPTLLGGSPVDKPAQVYAVSVDPGQRFLYVLDLVHKLDQFVINANGSLPATPALSTPIAGSPETLALDPKGRFAYVGTRTDDDKPLIDAFKIDAQSGALTSAGDPLELTGAPAYVAVDPTGHFAYVTVSTGFGLWGYTIDQASGLLSKIEGSPFGDNAVFGGAIAFRPDGKFFYTAGNGLNAFSIAANGKPTLLNATPINTDVSSDPSATNIAIDPQGKYLYASQFVGATPHLFGYAIDATSGNLTPTAGHSTPATSPYSLGIDPSGHFLWAGQDDGQFAAYAINRGSGALRKLDGAPFDHGGLQPEIAFATGR